MRHSVGLDKNGLGSEFVAQKCERGWKISFRASEGFGLSDEQREGKTDQRLVVLSEKRIYELQPRHSKPEMSWSFGSRVRFHYLDKYYLHAHSNHSLPADDCDWFEATWFPFEKSDNNDYWMTELVHREPHGTVVKK